MPQRDIRAGVRVAWIGRLSVRKLLELCCGTKSISKAMQAEGWQCTAVDIDPRFSPDVLCDVRDLEHSGHNFSQYDFVWASPPCDAFARLQLRGMNKFITIRDGEIDGAMSIVAACVSIAKSSGGYWILESTRGSVPHLARLLGAPYEVGGGSHYLYGCPPPGFAVTPYRGTKERRHGKAARYVYDNRLTASVVRALLDHYGR